ncbi:enoyl-(acyl carrier) reductase [Rhizoctonia solani AG-3 Rhs1AP]|uniref:Enoyl-(Acyl carrier) reductase n=2 Tax=Rhizoctonia solani AG-3 TaxID=1086053 RepID=A0A074SA86_9AGAM|nr:enoyl-(acyl carrier) reductase [Rhizoctonia solani AG-3 Rhs1AP]KEP54530.1 enoyl-(acyl carrier) reductase [Rhizoctonia solani 123E]
MTNSTELLRDQKVVIIGGSSGIGRSVAAAALAHKASVVIASSSPDKVKSAVVTLQQEFKGTTVEGQALDIKDNAALKSFLDQHGPFNHLVDLAGEMNFPHTEIDDSWKAKFDMRYWAVITAAQHVYKNNLIKPGGSIVLTIGIVHYRPIPGWSLINGMVGAVESATRGLAIDLKPIRAPGVTDTELFSTFSSEARANFFKTQQEKLPVGRVGTPEEVAEAYIFAMKCTFLTGQVITVDGGGALV